MIYSNIDRNFNNYNSDLIEYIKKENAYDGSPIIYSNKFTTGTFSINRPSSDYKNCKLVNGYPHFYIPLDICLNEINNFINEKPIYAFDFKIRYGDTHPHKPIPKLSQVRNIILNDILYNMILTSGQKQSIYTIGDISMKTLKNIVNTEEEIDIFFKNIVHGNRVDNDLTRKLISLTNISKMQIGQFLKELNCIAPKFLLESELYENQNLYKQIKNDFTYEDDLKSNGEFKYSLQELMFILGMVNSNERLYNIIGDNQLTHVLRVNKILSENNINLDTNFFIYGFCRNGEERKKDVWVDYLESFIKKNNLTLLNEKIEYYHLLKIIICTMNNSNIIDYLNLDKYLKNYTMIKEIYDSIQIAAMRKENDIINSSNDLINMMGLVNFYLNTSIEIGEQSKFFRYIYSIYKEFMKKDEYKKMSHLYYNFIISALKRISLDDIYQKKKVKEV